MNDLVPRPRNGLSLCSGGGGLDMGLMLAEPGFHTRCYVEWEEYPRDALIAAQRAGYLAAAPIWADVTTFDARPLAGAIDTLIAGYPCQGESVAGKRDGKDDERWLWEDIERIIGELGHHLTWCFFENVRGHVTLGLETVLRALRNMGFTVSSGIFSAEEVGATHERQRVFIVAYRAGADGERDRRQSTGGGRLANGGRSMADASSGTGHEGSAGQFRSSIGPRDARQTTGFGGSRPYLFPPGPSDMEAWQAVLESHPDLAPALSVGDVKRACDHFATMVESGHMAQETAERIVRRMASGMAARARALRLLGNGVVPLQAAYAWRSLSNAFGLRPLDMGAAGDYPTTDAGEFV